ncbi:PIG-L deacetylase family protein [Oceanospirillum linum]|uniref:GlcNAc-PI de-N-acetylase n=1 Tax=Oceanospirillum linum TaxID=966 RepID=A0A1T1HDZ8_OCELI|nr:PIG-L deacetylase family protein [Oceanospirillum linum]OOV88036.1 GlcNAc-PI de-N-acetylase [Oceanospirillum linum]SEF40977.1 N-acetylglucosaminyl deacetylase, LmbE family [Oleiphilus messinensis]SMP00551.1 N-acetylglucosaminyl deacetylase, LmbE family [Oceanospirillum linum]
MRKILIVAAHTDDEAIGCGGTIARHVASGNEVHLLFMTDGVSARGVQSAAAKIRLASAQKAAKILGTHSSKNLCFPDNQMDAVPLLSIVKEIEQVISELKPDIIYTHHASDLNIDHKITSQAVMTACRPQPGLSVKEIYTFEVLSSTDWQPSDLAPFTPNLYVDISDYLEQKKQALEAYDCEIRPAPHSRSYEHIEILAKHRGYSVGLHAAEAFIQLRRLDSDV